MHSLITASIGLFKVNGDYYLKLISANREEYYFVKIEALTAHIISKLEGLTIEDIEELPEGIILNGTPSLL